MTTLAATDRKTPTRMEMYRAILGCRLAEARIDQLAVAGEITAHHSALNHEALGVGVGMAVRFDDPVQTHYRTGAAVMHGRGALTVRELVLQGFELIPGPRAQHPDGPRTLRSTGMVGGQVPMAVGVALANKLARRPHVVVTHFGDGASHEGAVHEAMNIAGARDLPVVFIIENNGLGLSMRTTEATRAKNLADRGAGYGIEAEIVDGSKVAEVFEATRSAVERARSESLPKILEIKVTRPGPHVSGFGDPRTDAELAAAGAVDCVADERSRRIAAADIDEAGDATLVAELQSIVDDAVEEAREMRAASVSRGTQPERYTDAQAWALAHATAVPPHMEGPTREY